MRSGFQVLLLAAVLSLTGCGDGSSDSAKGGDDAANANNEPAKIEVVNEKCPICGMKVDASLGTIEYEGKHYGVGCAACVEPFKEDPAKYVKMIEDAKGADAPTTQPSEDG